MKNRAEIECIRLRRQLREAQSECVARLQSAVKDADYKRWVTETNTSIAKINAAIRATNK